NSKINLRERTIYTKDLTGSINLVHELVLLYFKFNFEPF
ncbi:hypothetical protein HMPREF0508_02322, partial [Lactobacillus crispatus MV-3A-US]